MGFSAVKLDPNVPEAISEWPIGQVSMSELDGAKLTMLGAAGFAVVDDRPFTARLEQADFKSFDLSTGTK